MKNQRDSQISGGFLKWQIPKTIDFNTQLILSDLNDLDDDGCAPVLGNHYQKVPVPLTTTININHDQPLLPSGNLT